MSLPNICLDFSGGSEGKASAMREIRVQSPGQEDAIHSNMLAGKIPWMEKPATVHGVAKSQTRLSDFTPSIFASG